MLEIVPYASVGPVAFSMSVERVLEVLGEPSADGRNFYERKSLLYGAMLVQFGDRDEGVVEVGLGPELPVVLGGVNVFSDSDVLSKLARMDRAPLELESEELVVLPRLGVSLMGFRSGDRSGLAITAFARGRWDDILPSMRPFGVPV